VTSLGNPSGKAISSNGTFLSTTKGSFFVSCFFFSPLDASEAYWDGDDDESLISWKPPFLLEIIMVRPAPTKTRPPNKRRSECMSRAIVLTVI
jgi:hypothetical protein